MPEERSLDDLELYLLDVMEDRRRGLGPELLRGLASGLSWFFMAGSELRKVLYARGLFRSRSAPLPVISVGNLTVGGTGKTPLVSCLARGLQKQHHRPAILARGYHSSGGQARNDEMMMLERQCPGLLTVGNPNRWAGAVTARESGADVALLDDGFQHLALKRDLDILLIDATRPFGNGRLLPRGTLRESTESAARADVAVLTRVDIAGLAPVGELRTWLKRLKPGMLVVSCSFRPRQLRSLTEAADDGGQLVLKPEDLAGRKIGAFAGLANPRGFGQTLRSLGAEVVYSRRFPDHHRYTSRDLESVVAAAGGGGAEMLVTTEKDAVKLEDLPAPDIPLFCLSIEAELEDGGDELWDRIGHAVAGFKRPDGA